MHIYRFLTRNKVIHLITFISTLYHLYLVTEYFPFHFHPVELVFYWDHVDVCLTYSSGWCSMTYNNQYLNHNLPINHNTKWACHCSNSLVAHKNIQCIINPLLINLCECSHKKNHFSKFLKSTINLSYRKSLPSVFGNLFYFT